MTSDEAFVGEGRPLGADERSGVLHPENLSRYRARVQDAATAVGTVVDQYWHVRWRLSEDESIDQRIIDLPAVTLTLEEGDVPAALVVTGVHSGVWRRRIGGRGGVFGIRLRPAGLAVLSELAPQDVADATLPVTTDLDGRLHALMTRIATEATPQGRTRAADAAIAERIAERPPTRAGLLANAVVDELRSRLRTRTGAPLSEHFGTSERTIQRALAATLGHGPKWVSRRIRLQEVARCLASRPTDEVSAIAAELGYADQAHLTRDFHAVAGVTPSVYRRDLARSCPRQDPDRARRA